MMNPVKQIAIAVFTVLIVMSWMILDVSWSETKEEKEDEKYEALRLKMV